MQRLTAWLGVATALQGALPHALRAQRSAFLRTALVRDNHNRIGPLFDTYHTFLTLLHFIIPAARSHGTARAAAVRVVMWRCRLLSPGVVAF